MSERLGLHLTVLLASAGFWGLVALLLVRG